MELVAESIQENSTMAKDGNKIFLETDYLQCQSDRNGGHRNLSPTTSVQRVSPVSSRKVFGNEILYFTPPGIAQRQSRPPRGEVNSETQRQSLEEFFFD